MLVCCEGELLQLLARGIKQHQSHFAGIGSCNCKVDASTGKTGPKRLSFACKVESLRPAHPKQAT